METLTFNKQEKLEYLIIDFLNSIRPLKQRDPDLYFEITATIRMKQSKTPQQNLAGFAFSFLYSIQHLQGSYPDLYWTNVIDLLQILTGND